MTTIGPDSREVYPSIQNEYFSILNLNSGIVFGVFSYVMTGSIEPILILSINAK